MFYFVLFIASLCIRLIYGYYSHYTEDEARVWQLGFYALQNGFPLNHGMPVVYSRALLPGSFQSILSGIPLLVSKNPFALIAFIQIINAFSQLLLYKWITALFPAFKNIIIFMFIVFAPWSILFSYAWNPSFLPIFSVAFVLGVSCLLKKGRKLTFLGHILILSPLFLTLQINLQVIPLIIFTIFLYLFKIIPRPSFSTLIYSQFPSVLTLIPWVSYKLGNSKLDEPTWGFIQPISQSIKLNFLNILDAPHQLLRLLSFVSGDTVNRFEHGFLLQHKFMFPLVILGEVASVALIIVSLTFYFSKERWIKAFEILKFKKNMRTNQSGNNVTDNIEPILEKIDFICLLLPFFLIFSSLFSITTLGVHSLLCLFFVPYYVFFRRVQEMGLFFILTNKKIIYPYILITLIYSLIGGASWRSTFNMIDKIAPKVCAGENISESLSKVEIYGQDEKAKGELEYTASLLCPYYLR